MMEVTIRPVTMDDYDDMLYLWNSAEQSRRALNPVDDSREGIDRYLRRNPDTCFAAVTENRLIGVILSGHDGRRGIIHHLCVHPDFRRMGIASRLVTCAEQSLQESRKSSDWCSRTTIRRTISGKARAIRFAPISTTGIKA